MNIAVIFAGGTGKRMNTMSRPKQFLELDGKPIIIYTLELFDNHPEIDGIVVACLESWIPYIEKLIKKYCLSKIFKVVPGGKTSQDSIYNALCAANEYSQNHKDNDTIVLIHDGVRPLITNKTISNNIAKVKECGSCITCVPAIETVLLSNNEEIVDIPKRTNCIIARAPQSFFLKDILSAHIKCREHGMFDFIDSCSMMKSLGYPIGVVYGPMENIKITTPMDYFVLKAMIQVRENQQVFGIFNEMERV